MKRYTNVIEVKKKERETTQVSLLMLFVIEIEGKT